MKTCSKCLTVKDFSAFCIERRSRDGYSRLCKACANAYQAERYYTHHNERLTCNPITGEPNLKRLRCHKYYVLKERTEGRTKQRHNSFGKELISKDDFYAWFDENIDSFMALHDTYVASNFDRKLIPSIDRLNNDLGYVRGNMQWITLTDNARKANKSWNYL